MTVQAGASVPWLRVSVVIPALNEARTYRTSSRACRRTCTRSSSSTASPSTTRSRWPGSCDPTCGSCCRTGGARATRWRAGSPPPPATSSSMIDADGSADPAEIPAFVAGARRRRRLRQGHAGSPRAAAATTSPGCARSGNRGPQRLRQRAATAPRYTDLCYGYNAFWRRPATGARPGRRLAAPPPATGRLWGDGFEIETLINFRVAAAGLRSPRSPASSTHGSTA